MLSRGGLVPETGAMLLIGASVFALALLLTAALHPELVGEAAGLAALVTSVVLYFSLGASVDH